MTDILKVDELRKEYPGVLAVNGLGFSLKQGEALALLGEMVPGNQQQ